MDEYKQTSGYQYFKNNGSDGDEYKILDGLVKPVYANSSEENSQTENCEYG